MLIVTITVIDHWLLILAESLLVVTDSGYLSSREVLGPAVGAESSQSSKQENTSFSSTGEAELRTTVGYSPHHQQLSTARDYKILQKNLAVAKQLLKDLSE